MHFAEYTDTVCNAEFIYLDRNDIAEFYQKCLPNGPDTFLEKQVYQRNKSKTLFVVKSLFYSYIN